MKTTNFLLGIIAVLLFLNLMAGNSLQLISSANAQQSKKTKTLDDIITVRIVGVDDNIKFNVKTEGTSYLPVMVCNGLNPYYKEDPKTFAIPTKNFEIK